MISNWISWMVYKSPKASENVLKWDFYLPPLLKSLSPHNVKDFMAYRRVMRKDLDHCSV